MNKFGRAALSVLLLVGVAVVALQVGALAGGGQNQVQEKRKDFALVGTVVSADPDAGTIEVRALSGFGPITAYIGEDKPNLVLTTDGDTQFSPAGTTLETMADGDNIRASGYYEEGVFRAYVVAIAP
ncbi:MAG: hypothetical protein HY321_02845 [Armatimonadetes bacterium]|nr:hypothetical protein [Armatimonadota bacterium]